MQKANCWIPLDHYDRIRRYLDVRTGAICDLLLHTGYRVDDVLRSRVGDWLYSGVILCGRSVSICEAKTGRVRTVELDDVAQCAVRRLVDCLPDTCDLLCPSARPRAGGLPYLHRSTVWRRWERAVMSAGLDGRGYTLHSLRHCYARNRYEDVGLLATQRDLGHRNIHTTLWYVFGDRVKL